MPTLDANSSLWPTFENLSSFFGLCPQPVKIKVIALVSGALCSDSDWPYGRRFIFQAFSSRLDFWSLLFHYVEKRSIFL